MASTVSGVFTVSAGPISQVKVAASVRWPLSVAVTMIVLVPVVAGGPEITPVAASIDRPAGRPVAVQV
ncbi:hypothetical protein [Actinoplanes sp. NPDC049118]|uniref:hypothetical protein n=1 Tax=Actinoplanes sp. NPDC049118 TaxID=3155769 RepID=UPI0033EA4F4E